MNSTTNEITKLVVLISGNGTNLQAIIDACSTGNLSSTKIVRVICENPVLLTLCIFTSLIDSQAIVKMLLGLNGPRRRRYLAHIITSSLVEGNILKMKRLPSTLLMMSMFSLILTMLAVTELSCHS